MTPYVWFKIIMTDLLFRAYLWKCVTHNTEDMQRHSSRVNMLILEDESMLQNITLGKFHHHISTIYQWFTVFQVILPTSLHWWGHVRLTAINGEIILLFLFYRSENRGTEGMNDLLRIALLLANRTREADEGSLSSEPRLFTSVLYLCPGSFARWCVCSFSMDRFLKLCFEPDLVRLLSSLIIHISAAI